MHEQIDIRKYLRMDKSQITSLKSINDKIRKYWLLRFEVNQQFIGDHDFILSNSIPITCNLNY